MPLYEYKCRECDGEFEVLVASASAARSATCPDCGAADPRRLMSVIAGMGNRAEVPMPVCGAGACARCS